MNSKLELNRNFLSNIFFTINLFTNFHKIKSRTLILNKQILPELTTVRRLVDYVLLNSCSVNSSGLYNGKAGMALALFEVSRYLQDEYIEEQAFDLLQEALLSKSEDISFENGLSGIGYVLIYLLENKFIEGDFEELFESKLEKIFVKLEKIENFLSNEQIASLLKIIYFFVSIEKHTNHNKRVHFINFFCEKANMFLEKNISDLGMPFNRCKKKEFLTFFETYIKVATYCAPYFTLSLLALKGYARLYEKNKLTSNFVIGHYLCNISPSICNIQNLKDVGETNKVIAVKNFHPNLMSLSQRIDVLCLLHQYQEKFKKLIDLLEKDIFVETRENILEKTLLQSINPVNFVASYQYGISRFVLYWVYKYNLNKSTFLWV